MMTRTSPLCVLSALLILGVTSSPILAAPPADRGKDRLLSLFVNAVSPIADSVVRVQSDGKDVVLGTIVTDNGYILTKGSELRGELSCLLHDGTAYDAKKVGYHKPSDLALLKIEAEHLKPIQFAKDDKAIVGNWVAVPGVRTSEPIAVGVVSAPARKLYGEQSIIENVNKGYLGIAMVDVEDEGVKITDVKSGTAAARAGMKKDDFIAEVAGKAIANREGLIELLEAYKPNESVTVRIRRGTDELTLKVKLGYRSEFDRGDFQNNMGGSLSGRRTGFPNVIQHDTILKPSDCGGPLVDLDGHVLGINIARAGRVETWTLPGSVIKPIMKDLIAGKYASISK